MMMALMALASCTGNDLPVAPLPPEQVFPPPADIPPIEQDLQEAKEPEPPQMPFEGKIAIVTNTVESGEVYYRPAQHIQEKFGQEQILHRTWPVNFGTEGEYMIKILDEVADDSDVKALIINGAVMGTNAAVHKFRERRDDVFIVYCNPSEREYSFWFLETPSNNSETGMTTVSKDDTFGFSYVVGNADLFFEWNAFDMAEPFVMQAKAMGAEAIVHYFDHSFPWRTGLEPSVARRDQMKEIAQREGISFFDLSFESGGYGAVVEHITQDAPKQVERLGVNTAFFGDSHLMQESIIRQVMATGAIFPQPCCPSPDHGFTSALDIQYMFPTGELNDEGLEVMATRTLKQTIEAISEVIAESGMSGRLSTAPMDHTMAFTYAAVEYAIKWINGEVPKDKGEIDMVALNQIFRDVIYEHSGVDGLGATLTPLSLDGTEYPHWIMVLQDYLVF